MSSSDDEYIPRGYPRPKKSPSRKRPAGPNLNRRKIRREGRAGEDEFGFDFRRMNARALDEIGGRRRTNPTIRGEEYRLATEITRHNRPRKLEEIADDIKNVNNQIPRSQKGNPILRKERERGLEQIYDLMEEYNYAYAMKHPQPGTEGRYEAIDQMEPTMANTISKYVDPENYQDMIRKSGDVARTLHDRRARIGTDIRSKNNQRHYETARKIRKDLLASRRNRFMEKMFHAYNFAKDAGSEELKEKIDKVLDSAENTMNTPDFDYESNSAMLERIMHKARDQFKDPVSVHPRSDVMKNADSKDILNKLNVQTTFNYPKAVKKGKKWTSISGQVDLRNDEIFKGIKRPARQDDESYEEYETRLAGEPPVGVSNERWIERQNKELLRLKTLWVLDGNKPSEFTRFRAQKHLVGPDNKLRQTLGIPEKIEDYKQNGFDETKHGVDGATSAADPANKNNDPKTSRKHHIFEDMPITAQLEDYSKKWNEYNEPVLLFDDDNIAATPGNNDEDGTPTQTNNVQDPDSTPQDISDEITGGLPPSMFRDNDMELFNPDPPEQNIDDTTSVNTETARSRVPSISPPRTTPPDDESDDGSLFLPDSGNSSPTVNSGTPTKEKSINDDGLDLSPSPDENDFHETRSKTPQEDLEWTEQDLQFDEQRDPYMEAELTQLLHPNRGTHKQPIDIDEEYDKYFNPFFEIRDAENAEYFNNIKKEPPSEFDQVEANPTFDELYKNLTPENEEHHSDERGSRSEGNLSNMLSNHISGHQENPILIDSSEDDSPVRSPSRYRQTVKEEPSKTQAALSDRLHDRALRESIVNFPRYPGHGMSTQVLDKEDDEASDAFFNAEETHMFDKHDTRRFKESRAHDKWEREQQREKQRLREYNQLRVSRNPKIFKR